MRKLEAEEAQRREEERRQREERDQQEKAAKKRALEIEMEARRQFERQEIERQERERAEAEQRERERQEELERQVYGSVRLYVSLCECVSGCVFVFAHSCIGFQEKARLEQQRLKQEHERLRREKEEQEERDRKMSEVEASGRALVKEVMKAVQQHDLAAAHAALQGLQAHHQAESLFVADELRGEEHRVADAVRKLEHEHSDTYHARISLVERGEADLESADTSLQVENLSMARELVCSSLEVLQDAAQPCVFGDVMIKLEPRIQSLLVQAQAMLQEVVVRVDCVDKAEKLVQASRARLAAGDCAQARALLQEARTALRRAQMTSHDADIKALSQDIDATEHLQRQRDAEEQCRRDLTNAGEVKLAEASAAMSEGDYAGARVLLQEAKGNFEQANAPAALFEEMDSMLQVCFCVCVYSMQYLCRSLIALSASVIGY